MIEDHVSMRCIEILERHNLNRTQSQRIDSERCSIGRKVVQNTGNRRTTRRIHQDELGRVAGAVGDVWKDQAAGKSSILVQWSSRCREKIEALVEHDAQTRSR